MEELQFIALIDYTTRSKSNHVLEGEMTMLVTMSEPKPCQRGRKLEKKKGTISLPRHRPPASNVHVSELEEARAQTIM